MVENPFENLPDYNINTASNTDRKHYGSSH